MDRIVFKVLFIAFILAFTPLSFSMTVEELKAGVLANSDSIRTLVCDMTTTANIMGRAVVAQATIYFKAPDKMRLEMNAGGMYTKQIYNGPYVTMYMPGQQPIKQRIDQLGQGKLNLPSEINFIKEFNNRGAIFETNSFVIKTYLGAGKYMLEGTPLDAQDDKSPVKFKKITMKVDDGEGAIDEVNYYDKNNVIVSQTIFTNTTISGVKFSSQMVTNVFVQGNVGTTTAKFQNVHINGGVSDNLFE